jgi:hypothetical protein
MYQLVEFIRNMAIVLGIGGFGLMRSGAYSLCAHHLAHHQ